MIVARTRFRFGGRVFRPGARVAGPEPSGAELESLVRLGYVEVQPDPEPEPVPDPDPEPESEPEETSSRRRRRRGRADEEE